MPISNPHGNSEKARLEVVGDGHGCSAIQYGRDYGQLMGIKIGERSSCLEERGINSMDLTGLGSA